MTRNERQAEFKKTVDIDEGRRRRTETTLAIRKDKKEQQLKKKRQGSAINNVGGDAFMVSAGITYAEYDLSVVTSDNTVTNAHTATLSDLPSFKSILFSPTSLSYDKIEATKGIRRLLSLERNSPVSHILDQGLLPVLIRNLTDDPTDFTLLFESAWAITNIASTDRAKDVADAGAIPPLIFLVTHDKNNVRDQAIWCLGNIAGEGPELRNIVLQSGIVKPLVQNLERPSDLSLLGNAVWLVSNLCRGKPSPDRSLTNQFIIPVLSLLQQEVLEGTSVLVDVLWGLSYLSDGDHDQIELVLRTGVASRLVKLLKSKADKAMILPICRILLNFTSGSNRQTQQLLDAGLLGSLPDLLKDANKKIRKEACFIASNIAAGTEDQISALIDTHLVLALLVDRALNGEWIERKEAIWTLSNVCVSGNAGHVKKVIQAGGVQPLVMVLTVENADSKLLQTTLEAIGCVITVGEENDLDCVRLVDEYDGINSIENLQNHPSTAVYEAAVKLIETHFGVEEDDENLAPHINGTTFGFGLSSPKQLFPTDWSNSSGSTRMQDQTFDFGIRQGSINYSSI